jgi:hypothetical protein
MGVSKTQKEWEDEKYEGRGPWMNTISGRAIFLTHPEKSEFVVEDIAYGLSNLCRFAGQTTRFYSVAQHCVLVSAIMPTPELALQGLIHDAAEAYTGDITSPMKSLMNGFKKDIELPIEEEIFRQLGVPFPMDPAIKAGDLLALATEIRDVMNGTLWQHPLPDPLPRRLIAWKPKFARQMWLDQWASLTA